MKILGLIVLYAVGLFLTQLLMNYGCKAQLREQQILKIFFLDWSRTPYYEITPSENFANTFGISSEWMKKSFVQLHYPKLSTSIFLTMQNKVFPAAILNNMVEVYEFLVDILYKVIYPIFLVLILVMSISLITVYVGIRNRGTIQSYLQRSKLQIKTSGWLGFWNLSEIRKFNEEKCLFIVGEIAQLEGTRGATRLASGFHQ